MKIFVTFLSMILVGLCAEAAQPMKRGDKNVAVLIPYRTNREIQRKHKTSEEINPEHVNEQLLELLVKERLGKRFNANIDDKRDHKKRDCDLSDSQEIDDSKNGNEKKTCYKNTYKKVLEAFEAALKSQIESYKKCVCQKKTPTTTTTTTTTEAPMDPNLEARNMSGDDSHEVFHHNHEALSNAVNDTDDLICFHKKYAFMLRKLLNLIPCNSKTANPTENENFKGHTVKRAERHNNIVRDYQDIEDSSESHEIDISEIKQKPKVTTSKPVKKEVEDENLEEKILAFLKDRLSSKNKRSEKSPKKIIIKPKKIAQSEEINESEEFSQQQFMKKLEKLFQKYQVESDETFPLQSEERPLQKTSSLLRKSPQKKTVTTTAVSEHSEESIEAVVKLKNRKFQKKLDQLKEVPRKTFGGRKVTAITHNDISSRKSNDPRNYSPEIDDAARDNNKKANSDRKTPRASHDDRIAGDFAKKISDFARGKFNKKML